MRVQLHELSGDACKSRRAFPIGIESEPGYSVQVAGIIKSAIRQMFQGVLLPADLDGYLLESMGHLSFRSERQMRIHAADAAKQIMRFVSSVQTEGLNPIPLPEAIVELGDNLEVVVRPDYLFRTEDGIEVVKLKCSKPRITQASASGNLEMYALLKYGEMLHEEMKASGLITDDQRVTGAVYYLRKQNDTNRSVDRPANFDTDFFLQKGGRNIIRLIKEPDESYDEDFEEIVREFSEGLPEEECSEDDCTKCMLYDLCKYEEPPIAIVKTPVAKSLRDLNLTKAQEEAINVESGVYRINAGAGAGKTMVIALRVVTLISKGVKPEDILLITFTNAGAEEMRTRIELCLKDFGLPADASKMPIMTFNAFGNDIIKNEYQRFGFAEEPKVIDAVEKNHIIAQMLRRNEVAGLDYRNMTMNTPTCMGALPITARVFDAIKSNGYGQADLDKLRRTMGGFARFCSGTALQELLSLYDEYDRLLREDNLIEFADQEMLLFELLRQDPYYLEQFQFHHIIVDEFQDTSESQIRLLKQMIECPTFESLMVVGDDSQSIFGFRDTSPEYIINFEKYIGKPVTDIFLLENHRSTPEIIEFANKINDKNRHKVAKDLVATRPSGKPVVAQGFHTKGEEQKYVIDAIKDKITNGTPEEDIAIICATKDELLQMAGLLEKEKIPSVMMNPEPLKDNSRVRATIALFAAMKSTNNIRDLLAYTNARVGGGLMEMSKDDIENEMEISRTIIRQIKAAEDESEKKELILATIRELNQNEDEVFQNFIDTLEYKRTNKMAEYCDDFYEYGDQAAYRRTHDYPGVVLTTAHSSKGLEWPVVFNMISKYHGRELKREAAIEEKRRLLFVSATRARDELYITSLYVAYGKRGDYTYNKFLIDCYDANGMEFSIQSIEEQKRLRELEKKKPKKTTEEDLPESA